MASPPRPSLSLGSCIARCSADSIQSDRGNEVVDDLHGARDLAEAADEEVSERSDPSFILDSGASHHTTSDKGLLSELAVEGTAAVMLTRGVGELPIAGTGSIVSEKFQLPHVLYAPDLVPGTVLVSVQQLAALGYDIMFGCGRCMVMGGSGGQVVGQGRLQEGDDRVYRLEFLKIPLNAAADGASTSV